jgi:hypothetical protein
VKQATAEAQPAPKKVDEEELRRSQSFMEDLRGYLIQEGLMVSALE